MARGLSMPIDESLVFSTSDTAVRILKDGSDNLLQAFQIGMFRESPRGMRLTVPTVPLSALADVDSRALLAQVDAFEMEMQSLGIVIAEV